ncbi:hypothetical protein BSG1_07991 [Bacillus sp. SG-1]|nr:hypothetical protein BSG1_07991 [Bacillus sp. SG-1]
MAEGHSFLNAVFVYIVALGKIQRAGFFPLETRAFFSEQGELALFFLFISYF